MTTHDDVHDLKEKHKHAVESWVTVGVNRRHTAKLVKRSVGQQFKAALGPHRRAAATGMHRPTYVYYTWDYTDAVPPEQPQQQQVDHREYKPMLLQPQLFKACQAHS